jgi:ATP-dependent DNA helicase DinG
VARARDLLGPGGPLASSLPGYEAREAQLTMADAVERALDQDGKLVCEAGTGTGKTLAYLIPAILSGRRVLVSTATKALQEQIFHKDLGLLARHGGLEVEAALLKGLGNYLCRRRYQEYRQTPEALEPERARSLALVERWVHETGSGDLAELGQLADADPIRAEIASSSETRIGQGCPYYEECFVTSARRQAEDAQLLVVNHHLFFADLALKGQNADAGALPAHDVVILDEAHQIEEIAADFFGLRVSGARVEALLRDVARALLKAGGGGKLVPVGWRSGPRSRLAAPGEGLLVIEQARHASEQFFAMLAAAVAQGDGARGPFHPGAWTRDELSTYHRLDTALEAVTLQPASGAAREAIEAMGRRVKQLRDDLAQIVDGSRGQVAWVEAGSRSVGASPVQVASLLRSRLFDAHGAVILTSATLATDQGFSFFRERVGLTDDSGPVQELRLTSPFDHAKNALLYVPSDLPDPPNYQEAAATRIVELVRLSGGGAFVLCTSVRSMRAFHARLRRERTGPLLLQGEAPKSLLLEKFRAAGDAILVATLSFWEGVDVPGHALRLVILDKLPFPVPGDPIVAARTASIEARGGNAFAEYFIPAAAITLKQGFGRLLRTGTDRGVVALLDRRVLHRTYGRALLASLPPARVTGWIEDVADFFGVPPPPPDEEDDRGW